MPGSGTEAYRELKNADQEGRKKSASVCANHDPHGRMAESTMRGSKSAHILAMELPHMVESVIDRSIDLRRNAGKPPIEVGDGEIDDPLKFPSNAPHNPLGLVL